MLTRYWQRVLDWRFDGFFTDENGNSLEEPNWLCWCKALWHALFPADVDPASVYGDECPNEHR